MSREVHRTQKEAYAALLELALKDDRVSGHEKRSLREFRKAHGISDAEHDDMLKKLGWSAQAFEDGVCSCPKQHYRALLSDAVK